MSKAHHESNIDWTFADGWSVMRYDNSTWYQKHFQGCADSAAVDFLVVQDNGEQVWLVEVKDFTTEPPDPDKPPLWQIITKKARDTLAGVLAGSVHANKECERELFRRAARATSLCVAFHCERPRHSTRLFKRLPDPADLRDKLRNTLRAIDRRVMVVDCFSTPEHLPWTATWKPQSGAT
jgi:hypothetical protein